ncbi:hypothetical protein [Pseudomonas luteola]|uniref:Uncharacterized protein n=1 Tax=Pseudomonas luteola TaxID=47886 RepID=A0ABS0FS95_PSELU|nr:hypothetical protein [Pseudomonas zeshuii]MBF8643154.1 hypothetical protein [Pseudomonas zeshuii]
MNVKESYFDLLLAAAIACAQHRLFFSIHPCPAAGSDAEKACSAAVYSAVSALERLARHCRKTGQDARHSPLFDAVGDLAYIYETTFDHGRAVRCDDLSPEAIRIALDRGNTLLCAEGEIRVSRPREITDEYGMPRWGYLTEVRSKEGKVWKFEEADPASLAQSIYTLLASCPP